MAEAILTLLTERIGNPRRPPEKRVLPGRLIEGNSAGLRQQRTPHTVGGMPVPTKGCIRSQN